MPTALCYGLEGFVRDLLAVCDVQPLEAHGILGEGNHGAVCDRVQAGHVERKETPIALEHGGEAEVSELLAVGQRQALDPVAVGQGLQGAITDFGSLEPG